jgi:acyl-CoA synthetase (AMP-forming)/AMP-acid ligase II
MLVYGVGDLILVFRKEAQVVMVPYRELIEAAGKWGGKTAFITDRKEEVSFEKLLDRVNRVAGALEKTGVKPGDVVTVMLPNGVYFVELFLAAGALGASFMPLDVRFRGEELRSAMAVTGTKVLVVDESIVAGLADGLPAVDVQILCGGEREGWISYESFVRSGTVPSSIATVDEDTDRGVYLYTSGSTESVKCVPMTWRQLDFFPADMSGRLGLGPQDRGFSLLPMSHISGPIIVSLVLRTGSSFVVTQRWRPDIIVDLFEQYKVTWTHSVPALADMILKGKPSGRDLSSLRFIALMGTRVPVTMLEDLEKAIPSCRAIQGYGLTETSPLLTLMTEESHAEKRGSIGSALPDVDIRVVDRDGNDVPPGEPGELIVRGPRVFEEYVGNPELTSRVFRDGWFCTGDVVRVDTIGYFFHLGRLDDVINTGGLKVYPAEVENTLLKRPEIEEAVAYGVPDDLRGFIVAADIKLTEGCSIEESDLHSFLVGELADYKIPRTLSFVDEIGHTATGKPVRKAQ